MVQSFAVSVVLCVCAAGVARAEPPLPPDAGGTVESMGQPPRWMPYAGLGAGAYRPAGDRTEPTGTLTVGIFHNLASPVASIGLAGEGYVGARGNLVDGGIRGLVSLRPLRLGIGVDYNIRDNAPDPGRAAGGGDRGGGGRHAPSRRRQLGGPLPREGLGDHGAPLSRAAG